MEVAEAALEVMAVEVDAVEVEKVHHMPQHMLQPQLQLEASE